MGSLCPTKNHNTKNYSIRVGVKTMEAVKSGADVLFIMLGAIMVLAMHAGFAFLELGTVRK
jgi:Amt family ammonium transporter